MSIPLAHHRRPTSTSGSDGGARSAARERGAALVEFALIATLLLTLVFGAIDIGYQWRFSHEAVGASRAGARIGARLGTDRLTDMNVLSTIRTSLDSVDMLDELSRVVVYRSDTANGRPPSSCLREVGPSGACNVYPASSIATPPVETNFNANGCMITGATYQNWCPAVRDVDQRTADYVGVMVVLETHSITGIFDGRTVQRHSVMRMEPTAK